MNDVLNGGDGDDKLVGRNGEDALNGQDGSDKLFGGGGNDWLHGGEGRDILSGGNDNDVMEGGAGNDFLTGGDGADVFVFTEAGDDTVDQVRDFNTADGDIADFQGLGDSLNWSDFAISDYRGNAMLSVEVVGQLEDVALFKGMDASEVDLKSFFDDGFFIV